MSKLAQTTILTVDDSETNRLLLRFTLEELGYLVEEAENGEKAVEAALENNYAAIFLDINMPIMDGLEAAEILTNLHYDAPIFACSAEENPDVIKNLLDGNFSAFISKPIEPRNIIEALQKFDILSSEKPAEIKIAHQQKIDQLTSRFIENVPVIIHKIKAAVADNQISDLKRLSHKLKGTASQFGFERVTRISREIESAIDKEKLPIAIEKTSYLIFELEKIKYESQPRI